jgi:high-affinity K+ transport system ATPase subunit B
MAKNPVMFVVEVGSVLTTLGCVATPSRTAGLGSSCRSRSGSG